MTEPVKTQFGWHVITLNETRIAELPTLEEVRPELENDLRAEAIDARVAELREAGTVVESDPSTINPAILRDLELLQ